ncbi:unnamed protein product [Tetraodon nigroviridis]|uniref:(spotted green pufferfish) hypothetical protein n=1 Tax=Tetraodon nigroviridis TaxID=99883 RepID=Q4T6R3_TETNG|nr:unnamed protein product [Tetraodon nigroviridis]
MNKENRIIGWIALVTALFVLGFAIEWFAKPTRSNVAQDSMSTRKYLREFLDEMQPDKIREHLR